MPPDPQPESPLPDLSRYARHLAIPEVGLEGQLRLLRSSVLIIGLGGLGCPVALYLAAAGVGTIGIIDGDCVDASNLQRQVLYGQSQVGQPKLDAAAQRLRDLNPDVAINSHPGRLTAENAPRIIPVYDVIIDATDNFPTRFISYAAARQAGKPWVMGAIHRFEGQVSVFNHAADQPCYRCIVPEEPAAGVVCSCAEAGVFGVLPGIAGSLQATETLKLLLGIGQPLVGKMLCFDTLRARFHSIPLARDPDCPHCSRPLSTSSPVSPSTPPSAMSIAEISPQDFLSLYRENSASLTILDVRNPDETAEGHLPEAILIPLGQLQQRAPELPPEAPGHPLYVYCHAGVRSARAAALLMALGRRDVIHVTGGFAALQRLGLPHC